MQRALYSGFLAMALLTPCSTSPATASPQELVVTEEDFAEQRVYSPYAGRAYADQVFFGDMHFHTCIFILNSHSTRVLSGPPWMFMMDSGWRAARK